MLPQMAMVPYQKPAMRWRTAGSDQCCHPFDFTHCRLMNVGHSSSYDSIHSLFVVHLCSASAQSVCLCFPLEPLPDWLLDVPDIPQHIGSPTGRKFTIMNNLLNPRPLSNPNKHGCSCSSSPMCIPPEPHCHIEDGQHRHQKACKDPAAPDTLALFSLQPACIVGKFTMLRML